MRYDVTIDGVSILNTYGAFVGRGGFREVVQWPALKPVSGNDWQEFDGFEPDLSDIHLDAKEATVNYICRGGLSALDAFWSYLAGKPSRSYAFAGLGLTVTMRLVSMTKLDYARAFSCISARYSVGTPLEGYSYQAPVSTGARTTGYSLDGTDLSAYGITILNGTLENMAKKPNVKPLLVRNINTQDGTEYDINPRLWNGSAWAQSSTYGDVTESAQDLVLHCYMYAPVATFWRNYNALLHDLVKESSFSDVTIKGARVLAMTEMGKNVKCYYKSQSLSDFTLFDNGNALAKFDLVLTAFEPWQAISEPYLELRPDVIWVMPWATNDVLSNIDWNIR